MAPAGLGTGRAMGVVGSSPGRLPAWGHSRARAQAPALAQPELRCPFSLPHFGIKFPVLGSVSGHSSGLTP